MNISFPHESFNNWKAHAKEAFEIWKENVRFYVELIAKCTTEDANALMVAVDDKVLQARAFHLEPFQAAEYILSSEN